MRCGRGDHWWWRAAVLFALLPLAALQAPDPAGGTRICLSASNITFTPSSPALSVSYSTTHTFGMHNLVGRVHRAFAALILPTPSIPSGLPPLDKVGDVAHSIVTAAASIFALVVLGGFLAAVVPITGLAVLCCRCVCGLCGGRSGDGEKKADASMRNTCGCVFSTVTLPLTLFLVCAIACFNHVPAMLSSFKAQAKFLEEHAPGILRKPLDDAEILVYNNSEEFAKAIGGRLDACANELGVSVDEVITNSPLAKFVDAAGKHLQAAEPAVSELTNAAEELDGEMGTLWALYIQNAAKELGDAESQCPGCVPPEHKTKMDSFDAAHLVVSGNVSPLQALADKLKNANFQQDIDQVRKGSGVKATVQGKMDEVKKSIAAFLGVAKDLHVTYAPSLTEGVNATIAKLRLLDSDPPDDVAELLPMYTAGIISAVVVMAVVTVAYVIGNNCSCCGNRTGLCSLRTGSWVLSTGVLFYLVTFSVPMLASSVSMALSIAIERYVCHPVENPASPQSREVVAFAYGLLFPKPTKKGPAEKAQGSRSGGSKRQGQAETFEELRFVDDERDDDAESGINVAAELHRHAHQLMETAGEGPLGNLDTPDVVLLDSSSSENTLPGTEEALYIPQIQPASRMRYVLRKHVTMLDQTSGRFAGSSNRYGAVKSLRSRSMSSAYSERRRKRAIIHRDGHPNEQTGEDGKELVAADGGTYVLLLPDEDNIAVHRTRQMLRHNSHGRVIGDDEVVDSGTELFAVLKDVAGYRKRQRNVLHQDRHVVGNVLFDEGESPVLSSSWKGTAQWTSTESLPARSGSEARSGVGIYSADIKKSATVARRKNADVGLDDFRPRQESMPLGLLGDVSFSIDDGPKGNQAVVLKRQWKVEKDTTFPGHRTVSGGGFKVVRGRRKARSRGGGQAIKSARKNRSKATVWEDIRRKELLHSRHYDQQPPEKVDVPEGKPPVDKLQAARKLLTLDAVLGILKRFADCDHDGLSAYELLGNDLFLDLAAIFLGDDSPWLGVFAESGVPPKFGAMDKLSVDIPPPEVPPELKNRLSSIASDSLKPSFFDGVEQSATAAKTALQSVIASREALKAWLQNPPQQGAPAQPYVTKAVADLDAITPDAVDSFEKSVQKVTTACDAVKKVIMVDQQTSITDFLQTNLNQWDFLLRNLSAGIRAVNEMLPKVKKAAASDVTSFYEHARAQVRERIGDCRLPHLLYSTTVKAVCEEGIRRFGEFWLCVWCFFLLGVPAFLVALSLSTYYAKASAPASSRRGSGVGET